MKAFREGTRVEWDCPVYGRATGQVTGLETRGGYVPVEPDVEFPLLRNRRPAEGRFMVQRHRLRPLRRTPEERAEAEAVAVVTQRARYYPGPPAQYAVGWGRHWLSAPDTMELKEKVKAVVLETWGAK